MREIVQEVIVRRDAVGELLVLRKEAAEAGALLRLGWNAELAEHVAHSGGVGLGLE